MAFLYQMLGSKVWPPRDVNPDFTGRTILITGANSGLGYESVVKFVRGSAKRIIIGVRSMEQGEAAKQAILAQNPDIKVAIDVYYVDMLDYGTIEAFASRVNHAVGSLDYVVLNAGVCPYTFKKSAYGFEAGLQVNLLSTTLLALLLLPKLMSSKTNDFTPVLELVGSGTHQRISKLLPDADNPARDALEVYNSEESFKNTGVLAQYSIAKLYLMYVQWHLVELVHHEESGSPRAYIVVVGPGPTQSALGKDAQERSLAIRLASYMLQSMMKTSEQGARTYVSGLMLGEQGHGQFWQWDAINRPAKWCSDPNASLRSERVWTSVMAALEKDVPEVAGLAARVKDGTPALGS